MRVKTKVWAAVLLFAAALLMTGAVCLMRLIILAEAPDKSGWDTQEGIVRYLDARGEPLLGWQTVDGQPYYFLPDGGKMATFWQEIGGKTYYFGQDGKFTTGRCTVEQQLYYFDQGGVMATGWQTVNGEKYYFSETGPALTGWQTLEGKRYYFTPEGKTLTGWQTIEEKQYYFTPEGHTLAGWQEIDGVRGRFDADGAPLSGWFEDEIGKYFFDEKGCPQVGWQDIDSKRYYFNPDGTMLTGWLTLEQDKYYFREDGTMAVGEVVIDGVSNFFTSKGKYVLLVNKRVPVPQDYVLDLVAIGNYQFDRTGRDSLEAMINACREAGYGCSINNTYRSKDLQQYLWNRSVNGYMAQGMSYEKACEETGKDTMIPGHSEHQTGLAVDLDGSKACYAWLAEHCWEYGFILRYPADRIEITGIIYEPWHFRYVGTELSLELKELGLCMEEYMTMLTK
ncbi:MAG: D-alanyl-D-alanine carboxypeptidase family protein [Oscillospiraceae bacterium]|nr:D-alanyl-D-alanine carboxypeptidase family protein [Oscillospiraceae bacterium]